MKALDDFRDYLTREKYSPVTINQYVRFVRRLLLYCRMSRRRDNLVAIQPEDIVAFYDNLSNQKVSPFNVKIIQASHRKFLAWAIRRGLCRKDLAEAIPEQPAAPIGQQYALTPQQRTLVMEAASLNLHPVAAAMVRIMASTGMRVSEVMALRRDSFKVVGKKRVVFTIKSAKARRGRERIRHPVMETDNNRAFREYLKWLQAEIDKYEAKHGKKSGDSLFPSFALGTAGWIRNRADLTLPASMSYISNAMSILRRLVQIPWLTSHTFRRTLVTILKTRGWTDMDIMAQFGHTDLKTSALYNLPSPEDMAQVAARYERGASPHKEA